MRHIFILAIALAVVAPGTTIAASTIGVYYNEDANICDGVINALEPVDLYIVAKPDPVQLPDGLTGAEFRVEPFDLDWITTVTPNPFSNIAIGNPIAGGCNIAFPSCQAPNVLLYTIRILAITPVSPRILTVLPHSIPSNPNFVCPLLTNCSAPIFGKVCAEGLNACVNRTQTCCILETEASTWTQVKSLYGTE